MKRAFNNNTKIYTSLTTGNKLPLFGIANDMHESNFSCEWRFHAFRGFFDSLVDSTWGILLFHRFPLCFHTSHVHNFLKHFCILFFPERFMNFLFFSKVPVLMLFTYPTNNISAITLWIPILTYHRINSVIITCDSVIFVIYLLTTSSIKK